MISHNFKLRDFLAEMRGRDHHEIIALAQREVAGAERGSYDVKGAVRRRERGNTRYVEQLEAFLFFMHLGRQPASMKKDELQIFRPLCEDLVQRGQFQPSILDVVHRE